MKICRFPALLVLFLFACSTQPSFPWKDVSFAQAQAQAGERMIMLDFYTDT
ncbi:hypothetical protein ACFL5M_03715 [Candidatus Neomarinimicrobiota bacterium]